MSPTEGDAPTMQGSPPAPVEAGPPAAAEPTPPAAAAEPEPAPAVAAEPAPAAAAEPAPAAAEPAPTPAEPVVAPAAAPAAPPPPTRPPAPDRPITAEVLRAAAGSPAEVKEILREEALRGRARAEAAALKAASAKAPAAGARAVVARSSSGRLARPVATPTAPLPRPAPAVPAAAAPASLPAPAPSVATPPVPAPLQPRPQAAATPAPATPAAAVPATPASAPRAASPKRPGGGRGTRIVLPAAKNLPFVVALLGQGLLILVGLYWIGRRVERAVAERPIAAPASESPPVPAPPATSTTSGPGGLVELGQGRAMLLAPDGRVMVLVADPISGELRLERVYELVQDPDRHLGTPLRRAHGYYLEDVERGAQERVAAARTRFERVVREAAEARGPASLDDAEEAALGLVQAGGADLLIPHLDPVGAERADAVRKHAATLALGRGGYLVAVESLAALLEQNRASERYAPRMKRLLAWLIGRPEVEALPPEEVVDIARAWAQTHPAAERPVRVPTPR